MALETPPIQPARPEHVAALARLIMMAGAGFYEFLLDDLVPDRNAADILTAAVAAEKGSVSYRQCRVIEAEGAVAAAINVFPTEWARADPRPKLPADRLQHLSCLDDVQIWDSFYLSAIAVEPPFRGRGFARSLINWAAEEGRRQGFRCLTLHAWADNDAARQMYDTLGFECRGIADIAWHPRLPHHGGSRLMALDL